MKKLPRDSLLVTIKIRSEIQVCGLESKLLVTTLASVKISSEGDPTRPPAPPPSVAHTVQQKPHWPGSQIT